MLGTWHEAIKPAEVVAPEPGKIYQLFMIRSQTEAYALLSQAEREPLSAKPRESQRDAKWIVAANSYWASEEYQGFGVFMYPNIDAVQHHFAGVKQIGWPRYMRSRTLLGTLREA